MTAAEIVQLVQMIERGVTLAIDAGIAINRLVGDIEQARSEGRPLTDEQIDAKWGEVPDLKVDGKTLGHLHHHEIMQCLDMVEFERGQKIAGHRGYFLKGVGVLLN